MHVGRPVDAVAFAQALTARYNIALWRVVAADIDRDGDDDVLAATDGELLVWINDGRGLLISQGPAHSPAVDVRPQGNTWHRGVTRDQDTIQNNVPPLRPPSTRSQAPPARVTKSASSLDAPRLSDCAHAAPRPRGPPPTP
jgi:hypothetical protein